MTKKLIRDLKWLAAQKGRSHHDASLSLSPPEARAILALLEERDQLPILADAVRSRVNLW